MSNRTPVPMATVAVEHARQCGYTQDMRIAAYRNLHKGLWSVKSLQRPNYGIVIDRTDTVLVEDAVLHVNERGRQRVIREGRKNVHATIRGQRCYPLRAHTVAWSAFGIDWRGVTYNPYSYATFVDRATLDPVLTARYVLLDSAGKAWYSTEGNL